MKDKLLALYQIFDKKFEEQFGFEIKDATFPKIVNYLYMPKDSTSLAVTRILFGLAMLFDIPDERGGAALAQRWGDPRMCHFPLLPVVTAAGLPYMALVYATLWFGALGIMLGYKYRVASASFVACYWYLLLIEKSYWNNHSYLFGLVGLLLACTEANCSWSLDAYINCSHRRSTVPYWNYFVLKYQFFILYFMAGLKKGTAEWLTGYSVARLSEHWVFGPFRLFLTVPQIDSLVVHWFVFAFDLTVAAWMMSARTRHVAMLFCALFHLMNSRLFTIGMFPWVCLGTMPLFYPFDWPKIVLNFIKDCYIKIKRVICNRRLSKTKMNTPKCDEKDLDDEKRKDYIICDDEIVDSERNINYTTNSDVEDNNEKFHDTRDKDTDNEVIDDTQNLVGNHRKSCTNKGFNSELHKCKALEEFIDLKKKNKDSKNKECVDHNKKITTYLIFFHIFMQAFLPYSHFITQGYNNWTNGLYGYSWDMMVHSWDTQSVIVKIVDNDRAKTFYIDPTVYAPNDRWTRHGDMVHQYAHCLKKNLMMQSRDSISENVSIYIDVWCSMNGRFTQRLFDSKIDLLDVSWSPFERVSFLMPLLDEALHWRSVLDDIRHEVHSQSDYDDVVFIADFPGYDQEKYIPYELTNVTLTILNGPVVFEPEVTKLRLGQSYHLTTGDQIKVDSGLFHRVINIGSAPAYYMYTFVNTTEISYASTKIAKSKLPLIRELLKRFADMFTFAELVTRYVFNVCSWMPRCF